MTAIALTVNGERVSAEVEPRTHLADLLREELRLTGTHLGCEHGVCGSCTVLVDDIPVRSCVTLAVACDGLDVRSIEGFPDDPVMAELRTAFSVKHGLQCGFCTPGMLIMARDVVLRIPDADERRIREELAGNLCRCTGYAGIVNAVKSVLDTRVKHEARARQPRDMPAAAPAPQKGAAPVAQSLPAPSATIPRVGAGPSPTAGDETRAGWTRFEEAFDLALPSGTVWTALKDFALVAACLPGAELLERGDRQVKGRMKVKLGPIAASFTGSATVEYDEAGQTGHVRGGGSDSGSGSRTSAEATYRVEDAPGGRGSRVALSVAYNLQGPLAQFSRSGLAQEVGRRLVGEFARNLNARLTGVNDRTPDTTGRAASLDAGGLLRSALRAWVRRRVDRLFGRSPSR